MCAYVLGKETYFKFIFEFKDIEKEFQFKLIHDGN